MLYSQIVVKLLEHIAELDGEHGSRHRGPRLQALTAAIASGDEQVTDRKVKLALDELNDHGLIEFRAFGTGLGRFNLVYHGLDVTGPGLRFLEALKAQAKAESKKESWFWSGVEKAVNLAQLISFVMQAVGAVRS